MSDYSLGHPEDAAATGNGSAIALLKQIRSLLGGTVGAAGNSDKAEDAAHASGDVGKLMLGVRTDTPAPLAGTTGDYQPPIFGAYGQEWVGLVDPSTGLAVTYASTAPVVGAAAHDAAISGAPVRGGGRAVTSDVAAVATGDTVDFIADTVGKQIVKSFAVADLDWSYAAAAAGISNTTTAVAFKAAAAAGLRNYITAIQMSSEALGAATELAIRDGAAGTVLWRTKIGTAGIVNGISIQFPTPLRGTAATLLEVITLTASITGAVYFNAQGYIAP